MARQYLQHKRGVNPVLVAFRQKAKPDHWRSVHCYRVDDTELAWAVHQKMPTKKGYVRQITEWFEKSMWDRLPASTNRKKNKVPLPVAFEHPVKLTAPMAEPEVPVRPKRESPKNPPPPIMLDEDEDETDEIPVASVAPAASGPRKTVSDREELPGEYNPRAHPEKPLGEPEDLIVFDDLVAQNFIAQQRKNKLLQLRSRQRLTATPGQPIVTGFEPG